MAPADCVQKSASIIQLAFFIIHEVERSAGRAAAAAVKEQTAVFGQSLLLMLALALNRPLIPNKGIKGPPTS